MSKLRLPKNPYTGLRLFCTVCKANNPKCRHYDRWAYRIRIHIAGSEKGVKSKVLKAKTYDEALDEAIAFKKSMLASNFQLDQPKLLKEKDYSYPAAVLKYHQYLSGNHELKQFRKVVSKGHKDEAIRYCRAFADILKFRHDISRLSVKKIDEYDVAALYEELEQKYHPRTFNKAMGCLKAFFTFLVDIEKVKFSNPFESYVTKSVSKGQIRTLTKDEFSKVLDAINVAEIYAENSKGKKRMHWPELDVAFKLFLLTGCRREEVIDLKWSQLMISVSGTRFFRIVNGKVKKQMEAKGQSGEPPLKYVPINVDLFKLLGELGYDKYKGQDRYILYANRTVQTKTIVDRVSKSFTHYRKQAGISKEVSLDELRKTYLSWMNTIMHKDTRILSSHASDEVLQDYYLDPTILSAIEKAALELRIFGS